MKRTIVICGITVAMFAAGMVIFSKYSIPAAAQRGVAPRIEYAVINGSYLPYPADGPSSVSGAVNICYLQANGCQNEEVRAEINIGKFLQDERMENSSRGRSLAQARAIQTGYSRAISKLGAEGWDMIGPPSIEFDISYVSQQGIQTIDEGARTERQHIWFKRYRQ